MLEKIIEILKSEKIENYLINETKTESHELFFVRRSLDMRREKSAVKYVVTVYRDFEKDGRKMRGSSAAHLFPTMTETEARDCIKSAYHAASFVCNPYFEIPAGETTVCPEPAALDLASAAEKMAAAMYRADTSDDAFINSAELFACRICKRVVNSRGVDATYVKYKVDGELVVQCTADEDVELYSVLSYDGVDEDAIYEKTAQQIEAVRQRSRARRDLPGGNYNVILDGENLRELLGYYLGRSSASSVYAKYSDYKVGDNVQGDDATGEKLNIEAIATVPFGDEGIAMKDRTLVKDGKLCMIHGNARFCDYLGIEPTGVYEKIRLDAGSMSFDEMKRDPYLYVVSFSSFETDVFTGHFGGEIRLAYLFDGKTVKPVCGGSIAGSIFKAQKNFVFSKERYRDSRYDGPLAVKIENVSVAGSLAQ